MHAHRDIDTLYFQFPSESLGGASDAPADAFKVTFYRHGFTVNEGPLRDGSTDADKAFMRDIQKG